MEIRAERAGDEATIRRVTAAAFAGAAHSAGTEPDIIDRLRIADALTISLVAEDQGAIVGHAAFSPVEIGTAAGWFGLGPVAVAPAQQRRGIGNALVVRGLALLREQGARGCVVLGDPAYYARFGFAHDPRVEYPGPPPEYFQIISFAGPAPAGVVRYHAAFGG